MLDPFQPLEYETGPLMAKPEIITSELWTLQLKKSKQRK